MINIEKRVKISCEALMKRADAYFSKNGLVCEENDPEHFCAYYTGGGGYVRIQCCPEDKGARVNIEGREWDFLIKQFLGGV